MRRVVILNRAAEDLEAGRDFYDRQKVGVGDYFKNSVIRDIEELIVLHGIHPIFFGFYRMLTSRFLSEFTIVKRSKRHK